MEFRLGAQAVRVTVPAREALLSDVGRRLEAREGFALATLNLDHMVKLRRDPGFCDAYDRHELVTADGNPVVWLARLSGQRVDLLPGADLILPLARQAARRGAPLGLIGATEETLIRAGAAIEAAAPGVRIAARIAPPMGFDPESPEADAILDQAVAAGARLIFLAMGAPRQERFAARARLRHPDLALVSIGAGLDFLAGTQKRAPRVIRWLALEWLWRVAHDPVRLAARYASCFAILPGLVMRALHVRLRP
ncbi:WecB/TagA/CpsF family glycosyltransferase [Limimaricola sp.]|uniref:WecB/TagA/CpsF family glycosyltransferase n=1 Tax=Limimaricola sp. TaxID=2211665 RepID=UPI004058EC6D